MVYSLSKSWIITFLFFTLVFLLTRKVPLEGEMFVMIMNLSLLGIFILSIKNILNELKFSNSVIRFSVIANFLLLSILIFYSVIVRGNELNLILRFYFILFIIPLAYFIKLPNKVVYVFFALYLVQAIFIIFFALMLYCFFTSKTYLPIRFFFQEQGWGDIYPLNKWIYKVQIKGNALLPFAYFITYIVKPTKGKKLCRIIFLLGTIVAGNFAFLISIFVFHLMLYFGESKTNNRLYYRFLIVLVSFIIMSVPLTNFVNDILVKKSYSLSMREEQKELLLNELSSGTDRLLLGSGLGNTIKISTNARNYENSIYYEVQSLYFLNQTGVLYFSFFIVINIIFIFYFFKRRYKLFLAYGCYLIYSITNPYIFDTNQIIVIFMLCTLARQKQVVNE